MYWMRAGVLTTLGLCAASWGYASTERPTFTEDVAPIFYENCVSCHRPGQIGPMSLGTYDEVRPWAKSIRKYVSQGEMPPWHADPEYGKFTNDRSLTQDEIDTIVRWTKRGAPEGPEGILPQFPEFPDDTWVLGEPDYIVEFERVEIPADGPDTFHDLYAEIDLPEDRWLKAVEILPENRTVAHHVIVYQDSGHGASPQGWIGAWAAGAEPMVFPEGTGRTLEKGGKLVADMHYHPSGEDATDATRVGLHFASDEEIEKELINLWIVNGGFSIPPGAENHEVQASHVFAQDSHIMGFAPHMHYRGKDFKYIATFPDGREETLMSVSNYDFNWQTVYTLEEPIAAPKGTRIDCIAHFDNSTNNPDNPDPTKRVTFGDESYDEMMIGFIDYIVDEGVAPERPQDIIARELDALAESHPGEVYQLHAVGESSSFMGLHLPKEGEGVFHLSVNMAYTACTVSHIEWNGSAFKSRVTIPNMMTFILDGDVDPASGDMKCTIRLMNGETIPVEGQLASVVTESS